MDSIYNGKSKDEIKDIIFTLHLQNTSGRESNREMFMAGISAAVDELIEEPHEYSLTGCPFCGSRDVSNGTGAKYCHACDKYWQNKQSKL